MRIFSLYSNLEIIKAVSFARIWCENPCTFHASLKSDKRILYKVSADDKWGL